MSEGLAREPPPQRDVELLFSRGTLRSSTLAALGRPAALDAIEVGRAILLSRRRSLERTPYDDVRVELVERRAHAAATPELLPLDPVARLRGALERAVDGAIGNARCVAVLAGGGVDSGALLAIASRLLRARGGEAFAVTIDFRAEGDDRPYMAMLERHVGCRVVRVRPEDARGMRGLVAGVDGAPYVFPVAPIEAEAVRRAHQLGAERVLTGGGADALFDGHPTDLASFVDEGGYLGAARRLRALRGFASKPGVVASIVRPRVARRIPVALRVRLAKRGVPFLPSWAGPRLRLLVAQAHQAWLVEVTQRLGAGLPLLRAPTEADRVEQAWFRHQQEIIGGLPMAEPYLDRELVELVHALPPHELLHGDLRRGLFREAIRDWVPEALRLRLDKSDFEPAMVRWVESVGGFRRFESLATGERLARLELVEPAAFRAAFDDFARTAMVGGGWSSVWPALAVEAFLREHGS